jgi:cysteine sulfinate desulfinase/cysteine desulfurase-like protein
MLTVVGHKFYGPRIGALYHRVSLAKEGGVSRAGPPIIAPLFFGGGQERSLR